MINLNVKRSDLASRDKLLETVGLALQKHLKDFVEKYEEDDQQYDGKIKATSSRYMTSPNLLLSQQSSPITEAYATKAKYIVDTSCSLFIGIPPTITKGGDESELKTLNKKLDHRGFNKALYNVGHQCSRYGVGYLLTFSKEGDLFPRYASLDPKKTNVVYDTSIDPSSLFGFYFNIEQKKVGNSVVDYYDIYVYTNEMYYHIETNDRNNLVGNIVDSGIHLFGKEPITEFKNNDGFIGDARPVYSLITAYNELQNNRLQNVKDTINYILWLKNVRIGTKEEQEAFKSLLESGILATEGDNTNAQFLTNPLNQSQIQELLKQIESDIYQISAVPNFNSDTFAISAGTSAIETKMLSFIYLVNEKERNFTPPLKRVLEMTKQFLETIGESVMVDFELEDVSVEYTHNLPNNDKEKITQIVSLDNIGLLDPQWALRQISTVEGVEDYLVRAKERYEYKKLFDLKAKEVNNDGGVNDTNIERQNKDGFTQEQLDNQSNANVGISQNIQ